MDLLQDTHNESIRGDGVSEEEIRVKSEPGLEGLDFLAELLQDTHNESIRGDGVSEEEIRVKSEPGLEGLDFLAELLQDTHNESIRGDGVSEEEIRVKSEPGLEGLDFLAELEQIMDEVEAYHQLKQEPLITPPPPSITLEDDTSLFTRRTKPAIDHSPSFESSTNNIYRDLVLSLSVNASAETSNSDQSKNKCDSWTSSKKNTHVVKGKDIQSGTSMRSRSRSLSRFRRKRSSPSAYREYNSNICRTQTTRRYSPPKKRSKSKKRSRDRSHPYRKSGTPSKAQGSLSRTRRMSSSLSADREYFLSSQTKTNRPNHKRQRSRSKDSDRTRRRDSSVEITYKTKAPRLDHNRERSKSKELIFYHSPRKAILPLERTLRSKSKERGQNRRRHSHLSRRSKSKDRSRVRKRLSPPYRKSRKPSPIRQKRNFSPSPRRSVYKSRRYSPARLPKRRSRSPRRPRWIPHIERSRSPSRLKRHPHFKRLRSPSRPKRSPHFCRSRSPSRPNLCHSRSPSLPIRNSHFEQPEKHTLNQSLGQDLIFYLSPRKAILPLERTLRSKSKERGQNRRRHSHLSRRSKSKDRSRVRKRLSPPYRKSRKPSPIRQKRNFSPSPRRSVYKSRRYSPARLPKRRSRSPRRPRWIPHIERSRSPSRPKRHPHFKRLRSPSRPKRSPHFCRSRSPSRPNLCHSRSPSLPIRNSHFEQPEKHTLNQSLGQLCMKSKIATQKLSRSRPNSPHIVEADPLGSPVPEYCLRASSKMPQPKAIENGKQDFILQPFRPASPIRPMPISAMVPLHNYQIGHSISVGSHVPPAPLMMCTPTRFTHFEYCEHRMHADCEPLPLNPASFAFNHCVTMTRSPVYLGPEDLRHRIQSTYRPNFNAPPFAPNAYPNWTVDFPRNYYY